MLFNGKIKIGAKYFSVRIFPDGVEPNEYIHQNSKLEEAHDKGNNYFATKKEADEVAKKFQEYLDKLKSKK
jgi:hypothetical protein